MYIFRCPIHADINISTIAKQLIDTKEFQRLRRIKQLGGAFLVFQGAEHTRFQHSIGVYAIIKKMKKNTDNSNFISETDWEKVLIAGLLHDIGHGPLSHGLENILDGKICHENMTKRIICEDTEINYILRNNRIDPNEIVSIIDGTHSNKNLCDIISSNIDADRMDYLLRDAYYTGTSFGKYDIERIIKAIIFTKNGIIFKYSALTSIENFILARFYAFKEIYSHRVSIAYEIMHKIAFDRINDIEEKGIKLNGNYSLIKNISNDMKLDDFFQLDDYSLFALVKKMQLEKDDILKSISNGILNRNLYKVFVGADCENVIKHILSEANRHSWNNKYLIVKSKTSKVAYKFNNQGINIYNKFEDKIIPLHQASPIIKATMGISINEEKLIVLNTLYKNIKK